jgi:hypothetical protein
MPDYTYLNNFPACRIHKSNAHSVKEECDLTLKYYRERLLVLSASTPCDVGEGEDKEPWVDYIQREVNTIVDDMLDQSHRLNLAQYIIDYPEDCEDELENSDSVAILY